MRYLEIGESMLSPRNEHHFLGAAISGIFGTLQQSSANRANFRNTQTTNKFNMLEAQKQRDWQEKMVDESREYNSPEAMIARKIQNKLLNVFDVIRTWFNNKINKNFSILSICTIKSYLHGYKVFSVNRNRRSSNHRSRFSSNFNTKHMRKRRHIT